jgi:hypothetical protein
MDKRQMNIIFLTGWAILLIALLVIRPPLRSPLAWCLSVPAFVLGAAYMISAKFEAKREQQKWQNWSQRLGGLTAHPDVKDDGHLYELFDQDEWSRIFAELERQPEKTRSLRKAILKVDPKFES